MEPQAPQQDQQPQPQGQFQQPAADMNQQPMAAQPQMAQVNPGQGLGIASLVCALLGISLVGLILGIMGMKKSKVVGMSNGMALAGVIISAIGLVVGFLWFLFFVLAIVSSS